MVDEIDVVVAVLLSDPFEGPFAAAFPILRRAFEDDRMALGDELLHERLAIEIADARKRNGPAFAVLADALQHPGLHARTPFREQPVHALTAQEMIHDEQGAVTAPVRRSEAIGWELRVACNALLSHCNGRQRRHGVTSRSVDS